MSEIIVLTQSESKPLEEPQVTELEEKIKEKTGKSAIVLPPGMTFDVRELRSKHYVKKTAKNKNSRR